MLRTKVFRAENIKILDEAEGRISAVVSSESIDRDGDIIRADGWNLERFKDHAVLLANHDYHSLKSQIGIWEDIKITGTKMHGVARIFSGRGNPEADWALELAREDSLAFSVGFIPDMAKATPLSKNSGESGMEYAGQELLEISAVTVPSNPDALQRIITRNFNPVLTEIAQKRLSLKAAEDELEDQESLAQRIAALVMEQIDERNKPEDEESGDDEVDVPFDEPVSDPEAEEETESEERSTVNDVDVYALAQAGAEQALNEFEFEEALNE